MLLRVGFYNRGNVLVSLYGSDPVVVLSLHHSIYRSISLVGPGELYLITGILENNNRRLLELLYGSHTILGSNGPLKILIIVSV
jgi:hypothetical protein